jgi:ribosomal protein S18 acetylase RimI-like enzyme
MNKQEDFKMIRMATENDILSIRALITSVPGLWHDEWRSDALEHALQSANGLAFVWEGEKTILGFSCAHDLGFLAYLSLLVVSESARGKGIGRELVQHTERELAKRGCATLISDVWQDAVGFYKAIGWSSPGAVLLRQRLGSVGHPA